MAKLSLIAFVAFFVSWAGASPFYFFADSPTASKVDPSGAVTAVEQHVHPHVHQFHHAVQQTGEETRQKPGESPEEFRMRVAGHLAQFARHGSSAVKNAAEQVQPDLKNLGKDLSDTYQQTRDSIAERIKPVAQTVKPFIEQAGRVVSKVGEQVRDNIQGLYSSIKEKTAQQQQQQQQLTGAANEAQKKLSGSINEAVGSVKKVGDQVSGVTNQLAEKTQAQA